jgi:hypothetical protein
MGMRNLWICCGFLFSLLLIGCSSSQTVNGLEFRRLKYSISPQGDTVNIIGFLEKDTRIQDIPIASGWVHFSPDWEPKTFCLTEPITWNNIDLPAGAWVVWSRQPARTIVVFPEDTEIQGYLCKGGGGSKGVQTSFYPSGQLKGFFTDGTIQVGSSQCKGGVLHSIQLHENGELRSCQLVTE